MGGGGRRDSGQGGACRVLDSRKQPGGQGGRGGTPHSLRDAALQALKGGVGCVVPSQKRNRGIIARYGALSEWQRSCGDASASGRGAGGPTTWALRLVVGPSPNLL